MTGKLKLLTKKIESRITDGEVLEDILASYDYLTQADITILTEHFQ